MYWKPNVISQEKLLQTKMSVDDAPAPWTNSRHDGRPVKELQTQT